MGQVIRLTTAPAAFPDTAAALNNAESALLSAIRSWVRDHRQGTDPLPRLLESLEAVGAHDAAFSIDRLMAVIARSTRRVIAIHCLRCPYLSGDEQHLLHAAGLVQAGDAQLAEKALRTTLLSAQGAEFMIGPLEGLGELFAEAKLIFRRRRLHPADEDARNTPEGEIDDSHAAWCWLDGIPPAILILED